MLLLSACRHLWNCMFISSGIMKSLWSGGRETCHHSQCRFCVMINLNSNTRNGSSWCHQHKLEDLRLPPFLLKNELLPHTTIKYTVIIEKSIVITQKSTILTYLIDLTFTFAFHSIHFMMYPLLLVVLKKTGLLIVNLL